MLSKKFEGYIVKICKNYAFICSSDMLHLQDFHFAPISPKNIRVGTKVSFFLKYEKVYNVTILNGMLFFFS